MSINLRLVYSLLGLALHCVVLLVAMCVLLVKDSERHMWMAFEEMQQYVLYLWIGLFIFCCLVARERDHIYQYGLSLLVTALFTWMIVGSYTRNTFTMITNQVGQVSLRYYIANLFKPVDMANVYRDLDEAIEEEDIKRKQRTAAKASGNDTDDSDNDGPEVVMREVLVAKGKKRR